MHQWVQAEPHETKGYAFRLGWHCLPEPTAPHLKMMKNRVWAKVEIEDYEKLYRPENQGGMWYLAERMRVVSYTNPGFQMYGNEAISGRIGDFTHWVIVS